MKILIKDKAGNKLVYGSGKIGVINSQGRYVTRSEFDKFVKRHDAYIDKKLPPNRHIQRSKPRRTNSDILSNFRIRI